MMQEQSIGDLLSALAEIIDESIHYGRSGIEIAGVLLNKFTISQAAQNNNLKCPCCLGAGKILPPQQNTKTDKNGHLSYAANALKAEGYTIREVAKLLGYKNPGSISHLLSKCPKKEGKRSAGKTNAMV